MNVFLLKEYFMDKLIFKKSMEINASTNKVWDALTDPAKIKQYLFGTNTVTDWKKGSKITYSGEWNGQKYEDKGTVVEVEPERLLHTTYFSFMSGKEDKPENYANVIYELQPKGEHTMLTLTQDNIDSEDQLKHMDENWSTVMAGLKKVAEQ
jgi:uncharacterized protein YndB with AHSA1/START domain